MTCLHCENKPKARGLCDKCYSSAVTLVKSGKYTWDNLVSVGLALPAMTRDMSGFMKKLEQLESTKSL